MERSTLNQTTKERVVLASAHFLCTNCNQEVLLIQTDCTTRYINQNLVNCCTIVETAVLRVLSDILQAVDRGDSAALILLDLSAAFDTVDHSILLQRLQTTFGIHDVAHRWFHSYLSGRYQYVRRGSVRSSVIELICGVPQGSVLGPILFVLSQQTSFN